MELLQFYYSEQQLAAVRRLAHEAAAAGWLSPELAAGISRVKGVKQLGFRSGNWLSAERSAAVVFVYTRKWLTLPSELQNCTVTYIVPNSPALC